MTGKPKGWSRLNTEWPDRAEMAAAYFESEDKILDIGCGKQTLRKLLPPGAQYQGLDIVERDASTIVVDLNQEELPKTDSTCVTVLGVFEYLDRPEQLMKALTEYPKVIISYNHFSLSDLIWKIFPKRRKVGWRNRFMKNKFRELLISSGLELLKIERVRRGELLYILRGPNARQTEGQVI